MINKNREIMRRDDIRSYYPLSFLLAVVATVLLIESTCLINAGGATNYWIFEQVQVEELQIYEQYYGFYEFCRRLLVAVKSDYYKYTCSDRFKYLLAPRPVYTTLQDKLKDVTFEARPWELACLGLLVISVLLNCFVIIVFISCCRCWRFYLDFLTPWSSVATVCSAVALGLFSNQINTKTYRPDLLMGRTAPEAVHFGWSFWLALSGVSLQFLATLLYGTAALLRRNCNM